MCPFISTENRVQFAIDSCYCCFQYSESKDFFYIDFVECRRVNNITFIVFISLYEISRPYVYRNRLPSRSFDILKTMYSKKLQFKYLYITYKGKIPLCWNTCLRKKLFLNSNNWLPLTIIGCFENEYGKKRLLAC